MEKELKLLILHLRIGQLERKKLYCISNFFAITIEKQSKSVQSEIKNDLGEIQKRTSPWILIGMRNLFDDLIFYIINDLLLIVLRERQIMSLALNQKTIHEIKRKQNSMKQAFLLLIGLLSAFIYLNKEKDARKQNMENHIQGNKKYSDSIIFKLIEIKRIRIALFNSQSQYEELEQNQITGEKQTIDFNDKQLNSVDWRKITQVKDQGQCGGCWAFGAIGAAEAWLDIKNKTTIVLSEQQLIDCDTQSFGLDLKYIANHGLNDAKVYPYTYKQSANCKLDSGPYKTNGAQNVSSNDWQFYGGGVFKDCNKSVNYAGLAVGYDKNNNWFVKNSWGTSWGDEGFITLAPQNNYGIISNAYRAI